MTIKRDGKEYELTSAEMFEAYLEQLHDFNRQDVTMVLDEYEEEYTADQFLDEFGFTLDYARENIDWLAYCKQSCQDGDGNGWREAVYLAFEKFLRKVREA